MASKGILKPSPHYGILFKSFAAALIGYVAGKLSYQGKCREKILQLENSQLADAIRHRRRVGSVWSDATDTHEYTGPLGSSQKSDLKVDVEYDANRSVDRHDETHRSSFDSDASLPSSSVDSATDVRASYDDLRRLNRAEHEKKKYDSLSRPSQSTPSVSTAQHSEPLKPSVKRNKYGDEIEV